MSSVPNPLSSLFKRSGSGRGSGGRLFRSSSEVPTVPSSPASASLLDCFNPFKRDDEDKDDSGSSLEPPSDTSNGSEMSTSKSKSTLNSQYAFVRNLGKGASGVVFEAQNKVSHKKVAIKEINIVKGVDVDKILREVQLVANLNHHVNVVSIYHTWIEESPSPVTQSLYFSMELCQEGTLRDWLDEHALNERVPNELLEFFKQLLRGVGHIHQAGLIHRDIKPANTMMSKEGSDTYKLKLGDFGIITKADSKPHTLNLGTPIYMSPEVEEDALYTNKVDIFALGMILIELHQDLSDLSDRREVLGEAKNGVIKPFTYKELAQKMLRHQHEERPEASQILDCLENQSGK